MTLIGVLSALTQLYGALLALYAILALSRGDRSRLAAFLGHGMPGVALPAVPLALLALLRRRPLTLLLFLPILLLLARRFLPRIMRAAPADVPDDPDTVSVLSFNLQSAAISLPRLVSLIWETRPDVLCLQEINRETADGLADTLAQTHPFRVIHTTDKGVDGIAIFSRRALDEAEFLPGDHGHWRVALRLPNDRSAALYNVHPSPPGGVRNLRGFSTQFREREIRAILERAADETLPVVLAGDFNMTEMSDDYARVTARYGDAFAQAGRGLGLTHPDLGVLHPALGGPWFGLTRLDYVFCSRELEARSARVLHDACGSDHRPLLVRLRLPAGERA